MHLTLCARMPAAAAAGIAGPRVPLPDGAALAAAMAKQAVPVILTQGTMGPGSVQLALPGGLPPGLQLALPAGLTASGGLGPQQAHQLMASPILQGLQQQGPLMLVMQHGGGMALASAAASPQAQPQLMLQVQPSPLAASQLAATSVQQSPAAAAALPPEQQQPLPLPQPQPPQQQAAPGLPSPAMPPPLLGDPAAVAAAVAAAIKMEQQVQVGDMAAAINNLTGIAS